MIRFCFTLLAIFFCARSAPADPPNVILFIVDDLGWQDTQLQLADEPTRNNTLLRTPSILRLANDGIMLTDAYAASPVCSPTRVSILTGQHPARLRITDWLGHFGPQGQPDPSTTSLDQHRGIPDWNRVGLTSANRTLADVLRAHGYRTMHVGKAHLGTRGNEGADPRSLGFDINIAGWERGAPGSYYGEQNYGTPASGWQVPGLEHYHGRPIYLTDALTIESERLIRQAVADDAPFFLHLSHYGVHTPVHPDPARVQPYRELGMTEPEANYASMIESVDASLGRMLDVLDELQVAADTIIWFMSDNGCLTAHSGPLTTAAPLKGGKGTAYEGGTRIPMAVRWPRSIPAGQRSGHPVLTDDVAPTVLSLLGLDPVAELDQPSDGADLAPILRGTPVTPRRRIIPIHYPHYWWRALGPYNTPGIEPFTSFRSGDWKLIYFYNDDRVELYNLATDVGEEHDLAGSTRHHHLRERLQRELATWMRAVDAQLMRDRAQDTERPLPF